MYTSDSLGSDILYNIRTTHYVCNFPYTHLVLRYNIFIIKVIDYNIKT